MMKGRSPVVSGLAFTHRDADEKKFPALCRPAPSGRHLCRTHAKEFPSSIRSGIVRAKQIGVRRDERNFLPSLAGLAKWTGRSPSHKWLGYFRGIDSMPRRSMKKFISPGVGFD